MDRIAGFVSFPRDIGPVKPAAALLLLVACRRHFQGETMAITARAGVAAGAAPIPVGSSPGAPLRPPPFVEHRAVSGLPPKAKRKYLDIARAASDAHSLLQIVTTELRDARDAKAKIGDINPFQSPYRDQAGRPLPEPEYAAQQRKQRQEEAGALQETIDRLNALVTDRREVWTALAQTVARADRYCEDLPRGVRLEDHIGEPLKLKKGVLPSDELERVRNEISELFANLHECRSAPRPAAEAKQAMRKHIQELGNRAVPSAYHFLDGLDHIPAWPSTSISTEVGAAGGSGIAHLELAIPDVTGLLAWACGELIIKRLEHELDLLSEDDTGALTATERVAKERTILASILQHERIEEMLVCETNASRRPDADPRAVLGIDGPSPKEE